MFLGKVLAPDQLDEDGNPKDNLCETVCLRKGKKILIALSEDSADLWVENMSAILHEFKEKAVVVVFLIIPSNMQFVKHIVKEAALCSRTGHHEMMKSICATIHSCFCHLPNEKKNKTPQVQGNDDVVDASDVESAVVIDGADNDDKALDGDNESDEDNDKASNLCSQASKVVKFVGRSQNQKKSISKATWAHHGISEVCSSHAQIDNTKASLGEQEFDETWKCINLTLTDKQKWQCTECTNEFLENLNEDDTAGPSTLSACQRNVGVCHAPVVNDRVLLCSVKLCDNPECANFLKVKLEEHEILILMNKAGTKLNFWSMKMALFEVGSGK